MSVDQHAPAPIAVSRKQAAALIGLSVDSIGRAVRAGRLVEHYPVPGKAVIFVEDLRAWIAASSTESGQTR